MILHAIEFSVEPAVYFCKFGAKFTYGFREYDDRPNRHRNGANGYDTSYYFCAKYVHCVHLLVGAVTGQTRVHCIRTTIFLHIKLNKKGLARKQRIVCSLNEEMFVR